MELWAKPGSIPGRRVVGFSDSREVALLEQSSTSWQKALRPLWAALCSRDFPSDSKKNRDEGGKVDWRTHFFSKHRWQQFLRAFSAAGVPEQLILSFVGGELFEDELLGTVETLPATDDVDAWEKLALDPPHAEVFASFVQEVHDGSCPPVEDCDREWRDALARAARTVSFDVASGCLAVPLRGFIHLCLALGRGMGPPDVTTELSHGMYIGFCSKVCLATGAHKRRGMPSSSLEVSVWARAKVGSDGAVLQLKTCSANHTDHPPQGCCKLCDAAHALELGSMGIVEVDEDPIFGDRSLCVVHGPLQNECNGGFGLVARKRSLGGCALGVLMYGYEQSRVNWPIDHFEAWGDWGTSLLPGLWLTPCTPAAWKDFSVGWHSEAFQRASQGYKRG